MQVSLPNQASVRFQGRKEVFEALDEVQRLIPQSQDAKLVRTVSYLTYGSINPERIAKKHKRITKLDIRRTALEISLYKDQLTERQHGEYRSACGLNGDHYSRWVGHVHEKVTADEAGKIRGKRELPPQNGFQRVVKQLELFSLKARLLTFAMRQGLAYDVSALLSSHQLNPSKGFNMTFGRPENSSQPEPQTPEELESRLWDLMSLILYNDENKENAKAWIKEYEAEKGLSKQTKAFLGNIEESFLDTRYQYDVRGYATHSM